MHSLLTLKQATKYRSGEEITTIVRVPGVHSSPAVIKRLAASA